MELRDHDRTPTQDDMFDMKKDEVKFRPLMRKGHSF